MVERALRAAGLKTGRYTSPHLDRIEERVAIDGRAIDPDTFERVTADVLDAVDAAIANGTLTVPPTFFEVSTAVAFEIFKRAAVDVAVVEVGLGGRFDATNVLTPTITAITSIAFDHERHLGHTLSDDRLRKGRHRQAGRAARDRTAAAKKRPRASPRSRAAIGAPIVDAHATTTDRTYPPLTLALPGRHQLDNAAVAVGDSRAVVDATSVTCRPGPLSRA